VVNLSALMTLALPVALTIGGLIVGLVLQRVLFARLPRGHVLVNVLRGPMALWGAILGLYIAAEFVEVSPRVAVLIQHSLLVLVIFSATWALAGWPALMRRTPRGMYRAGSRSACS
jgi:hypothetical protein